MPLGDPGLKSEDMQVLRAPVRHLQFEVDILDENPYSIKKLGANLTVLKNPEKVVIIGAL